MNATFQAKFLQHLNARRSNAGFTLIELLVVIIIVGILSAIALPAFFNQASKAKQTEARQYVSSMNRAQQAYYLEKGMFADQISFGSLGLGIQTQTTNYTYNITGGGTGGGGAATTVTNQAQPRTNAIKAYIGGVQLGTVASTSEATTLAILCEAIKANGVIGAATGAETPAFNSNGDPQCNPGQYAKL